MQQCVDMSVRCLAAFREHYFIYYADHLIVMIVLTFGWNSDYVL